MTQSHVIPDGVFDALARGEGGRDAVRLLRSTRRSRNLLLLRNVLDGPCGPAAKDAVDLLARVERAAPAAFDAVMDSPSFGGWAARAARDCPAHKRDGSCTARSLGALAAVAAIRAGLAAAIPVPVREGRVYLPGLGTVLHRAGGREVLLVTGDGPAVQIRAGRHVLGLPRDPSRPGHDWLPVAVLRVEHGGLELVLPLETADPLLPALDPGKAGPAAWQGLLQPAWELLVERHRGRAAELAAGLSGIVPRPAPARGVTSATSRHAFGTVLASWPAGPERLALTLLHEFQHSKLSALTDLVALHEPGGRPVLYAPWRPDPRPPGGLLQGIYAHLGDLAFWRDRSGASPGPEQADAVWRFAQITAYAQRGLAEAETRVHLTRLGERFLARVAETVRHTGYPHDPDTDTDTDTDAAADDDRLWQAIARVEAGGEAAWRLRWARVDAAEVGRLADHWRAGRPPERLPADDVGAASGPVAGPDPALVRWAARQRGAVRSVPLRAAAEAAVACPYRVERWAEFAAAAAEAGAPGADVLRGRAELVRTLLAELAGHPVVPGPDPAPDPLALAEWLARAEPSRGGRRTGSTREGQVADEGQNTGVSMSQKARSPFANTSATG